MNVSIYRIGYPQWRQVRQQLPGYWAYAYAKGTVADAVYKQVARDLHVRGDRIRLYTEDEQELERQEELADCILGLRVMPPRVEPPASQRMRKTQVSHKRVMLQFAKVARKLCRLSRRVRRLEEMMRAGAGEGSDSGSEGSDLADPDRGQKNDSNTIRVPLMDLPSTQPEEIEITILGISQVQKVIAPESATLEDVLRTLHGLGISVRWGAFRRMLRIKPQAALSDGDVLTLRQNQQTVRGGLHRVSSDGRPPQQDQELGYSLESTWTLWNLLWSPQTTSIKHQKAWFSPC